MSLDDFGSVKKDAIWPTVTGVRPLPAGAVDLTSQPQHKIGSILLGLEKMVPTKKSTGKTGMISRGTNSVDKGKSLHGEILTKLRDYLVEGSLLDGERIPERQLCETFGISRTPLREALKVLAAEGIIDLLPNRGARLRSIGREELRELFDVMGGLEGLAGRLACENITQGEYAAIEKLHHEMYGHYLRRDRHEYFSCNQKIHEKILAAARNERLAQAHAAVAHQLRRSRYSTNLSHTKDRWSESMREHESILDALHRRAGGELSEIFFSHLRNNAIAAIAHLDEAKSEVAAAAARPDGVSG